MRLFKKKHAENLAEYLIWRSTGIFGDFRFPTLIQIQLWEQYILTDDDNQRILTRYKEHCKHWNIPRETIRYELHAYSLVTKIDPSHTYQLFDNLP